MSAEPISQALAVVDDAMRALSSVRRRLEALPPAGQLVLELDAHTEPSERGR